MVAAPHIPSIAVFASHRIVALLVLGFCLVVVDQTALGQFPAQLAPQSYPSEQYYLALDIYRSGDLPAALQAFDGALSRTRRDQLGRWIDAIPVHAMLAECHYEAGNLNLAKEHLDQALAIMIRYKGWIRELEWPAAAAAARQPDRLAPWWVGPPLMPAAWPAKVPLPMGTSGAELERLLQQGGTFETYQAVTIDAVEILRGLSVALYRRAVILGPLAVDEPLLEQAVAAIGSVPSGAGVVGSGVVGSVRGIARAADAQDTAAANTAAQAALLPGTFVHPLTPVALLMAARIAAQSDQPSSAYGPAMHASAAAVTLGQPEWVAEAFRLAAGVRSPQAVGELAQAATLATGLYARDSRSAAASLAAVAAEAAVDGGRPGDAAAALEQARAVLQRRDVQLPRTEAYAQYVAARVAAAAGNQAASATALNSVAAFAAQRGRILSIPRLYQLRLIETASRAAAIGGKTGDELLSEYLGQPPASVWALDPVDALGMLNADTSAALNGWIRAAATRGAAEDVLIRGDMAFARQFHNALPLTGRVLHVRWLAAAQETLLSEDAVKLRTQGNPALARLHQLVSAPPAADAGPLHQQAELAESLSYQIALQRTPLPHCFPPAIVESTDLQSLPADAAMLAYIPNGDTLIGVLATKAGTQMWPVAAPRSLPPQILRLLRNIGVGRRGAGTSQLSDTAAWQLDASQLRSRLIPNIDHLADVRQLVVVPTGALWYLPFELLPVGDAGSPLLADQIQITYAPSPGLALHPLPAAAGNRPLGLLSGLLYAPRDPDRNEELAASVREVADPLLTLPGTSPVAGRWLTAQVQHLVVAAPLTPAAVPTPLAWSPLAYDGGMAGGQLADWMQFPWQSPTTVVLPAMRSAASRGVVGNGDELFYSAMAMHASGVRSMLLSRWPVGGQSTAVLMRELVQELPHIGLRQAWQRAVLALRRTELDPTGEPLLTSGDASTESLTGAEPLFWAGYLVMAAIEPAESPASAEEAAPAAGAAPAAMPAEGAAPADGEMPAEGTAPADGAAAADGELPAEEAAAANGEMPADVPERP